MLMFPTMTGDQLRSAAEAAVELFGTAPPFKVLSGDAAAFQCIYPLAAHAMEQVRSALALIDLG